MIVSTQLFVVACVASLSIASQNPGYNPNPYGNPGGSGGNPYQQNYPPGPNPYGDNRDRQQFGRNNYPPEYGAPGYFNQGGMQQPPQQEGGFFSKIKSSIFAAGNAIAGGFEDLSGGGNQQQNSYNYPALMPPPQDTQQQQQQQPYGSRPPPPPPMGGRGGPAYDRYPPQSQQKPYAGEEGTGGIFNKIKNFLKDEDGPGTGTAYPRNPATGGPPGNMYGQSPPNFHGPGGYGSPNGAQRPPPPEANAGPDAAGNTYPLRPTAPQADQRAFGQPNQPRGWDGASANQPPSREGPPSAPPAAPAYGGFAAQQQQQYPPMQQQQLQQHQQQQQMPPGMVTSPRMQGYPPGMAGPNYGAPMQIEPEPVDPLSLISSEPQILSVDDSIVMILNPREFFRKKMAMTAAGASNIHFFSDFEHVLTHFKGDDGSKTYGTAELLESSNALQPTAQQQLRAIAEDFEAKAAAAVAASATSAAAKPSEPRPKVDVESVADGLSEFVTPPPPPQAPVTGSSFLDDPASFEDFTMRCQQVIAKSGGLHIASIPPLTKEFMGKIGLRDGWKEALESLSVKGVPMYLFSSGYGDVVAQALMQGGLSASGVAALASELSRNDQAAASSQYMQYLQQQQQQLYAIGAQNPTALPPNVRIVSNFFRTAPDGTVRAFSQPIVHERNKNASTASRQMNMPVPERPFAVVLGAHEDDVQMTDGLLELQDQVSIGYLDVGDDLTQRLPTFLNTFDVVVIGEGSFKFVGSFIEDVLNLAPNKASKKPPTDVDASIGSKFGSTLKNRFSSLFAGNNGQQQGQQGPVPPQRPAQPPMYAPPGMQGSGTYGGSGPYHPPQQRQQEDQRPNYMDYYDF